MLLYSLIIIGATLIISVANIFLNPMNHPWYFYLIAGAIFTVSLILIDGFFAWIFRCIPEKWIHDEKKIYTMSPREKKFYDFLRVKKWKEKVPELGGFTSFHKNKVTDPFNKEYINRFILEACYGILCHYWSAPLGFLVIFIDYKMFLGQSNLWYTMAIPQACVNAVLIILPAFILKYNLPKLKMIRKHNERVEAKEKSPTM